MADMLATANTWLAEQMKTHLSRTVRYRRPAVIAEGGPLNVTIEEIQATIGRTVFEEVSVEGVYYARTESRDFLIDAADLVLDGEQTLPQAGDEIDETEGDTTYSYQVLPMGNEPCFRWCDSSRLKLRIHTKQIQIEVES